MISGLLSILAASAAAAAPMPYAEESERNHLCWITDVARRADGVAVQFRHPVAVMASDESGGPDKLFINPGADPAPADGSSSRPYPALLLGKGGRFTMDGRGDGDCRAELDREDDGTEVLIIAAQTPAQGKQPRRTVHERLPVRGHTAFADELNGLAKSHHYYSYHRDTHSEMLVMMPASLADRPETLGRAGRVSGEMIDGLRLIAQSTGAQEAGPVAPWHLGLHWQETGRFGPFTSLIAEGRLFRGLGHPQPTALAMFDDNSTGQVVTDMTDLFADNLASAHSTYCALLDIQRLARGLTPESRKSPIDARGRYLDKWDCPNFGLLAISFSGEAGQPMDTLIARAAPGVAGPESDGAYTVRLRLTATILAEVKPAYRQAFRPWVERAEP
jgi:hypothetical protein